MWSPASLLLQFIGSGSPTQSWKRLENPQILVERLAAAIVTLQLLQLVLHHVRFWARHWSVRWGAWAAFYLPVPLAAVAVVVMPRFQCPYWLVAILFAAGQADAMAGCSLRDDLQIVRRFAKRALCIAYLMVFLFQNWDGVASRKMRWMEILSLSLGFVIVLQDLEISSRDMTSSLEISKIAADHVRIQLRNRPDLSPIFRGSAGIWYHEDPPEPWPSYQSAVSGCKTLEDLRMTTEYRLVSSIRLEDACLSSALFLQLVQRRHEALEPCSANHAFKGHVRDIERAFKIVEVQLSLMYEYFFSKHGSPSCTSYRLYVTYSVLKMGFLQSVRSLMLEEEEPQGRVISATLYALISLEICMLVAYLKSNGLLVSSMSERGWEWGNLISTVPMALLSFLLFLLGWEWREQLEQYSLVEDLDPRPGLKQRFKARLMGRRRRPHHRERGNISLGNIKIGPPSSSNLSWHFHQLRSWIGRQAVCSEPKRFAFDGPSLMAVTPSLHDLSWSLEQETTVHTILVWHIATWFCAMADAENTKFLSLERFIPSEHTFATMLSNYCAYLVAFRPELLPEHHALTASIFNEAVRQAELNLERGTSSDERFAKLKSLRWYWQTMCRSDASRGFLMQGMQLGEQLMRYRGSERWKVMAEFWAEMTMFVARSGDADAHIEHLARGGEGELVTQLWAFQSNGWDRTFIRGDNDHDDMNSWPALGDEDAARLMLGRMIDLLPTLFEDQD